MKRAAVTLALIVALPCGARAQSLFSTHGLGVPLQGVDARARALNVNGVGLLGLSAALLNPAEAGGMLRRGISATIQPWSANVKLNGEEGSVGGTRFPLITVMYPIRRFTFTLGYSGQFDQSWAIFAEGKQLVGGDTVATLDLIRSVGGIGELRIGSAYMVNARLSLGAAIGLHTGSAERTLTRQFPDTSLDLTTFQTNSRWDYSGPLAAVGMRWDPNARVRIGASATWSGTLDATAQEGATTSYSYDLPLRLAAGVSASVSPRLLLAASTTFSNYNETASFSAPGSSLQTVANRTIEVGGGLEWSELRTPTRIFPLRAGFRVTRLPYHEVGEESATEWTASVGLGLRLVEDDFGPLAVADLGFERGKRDGWKSATAVDGLSESFWRFTASVSLFGR